MFIQVELSRIKLKKKSLDPIHYSRSNF